MDEVKKKLKGEKTTPPQDRVTLNPPVSEKLNRWIDQLNDKFKGLVAINKSDLVNYFVEKLPDVLNRDQVDKIKAAHYDEVRFMQWALVKVKESKRNGEGLSLKDLMQLYEPRSGDEGKRTKKAKSAESASPVVETDSLAPKNESDDDTAKPYPV